MVPYQYVEAGCRLANHQYLPLKSVGNKVFVYNHLKTIM